jgi:diguanylate cyclase (GGDEF)-like protein
MTGTVVLSAALGFHLLVIAPLQRLRKALERAERDGSLTRAQVQANDEIGQLATVFNRMLARITALRATEIDNQRDLVQAQEQLSLKQVLEATNAKLQNRLNELSLLYEVARSFTSTLELPELLSRISALVAERLNIPQFSIMLVNDEGALEVKSAYPSGQGTEGQSFKIDEGACGRAAQLGRTVYIPDLDADTTIYISRSGSKREHGALLSVPMIHKGMLLGVLNFQRAERASFGTEEIEVLTTIADQAAMAAKNARLHEDMVALSRTDPLTGVSNRRHLATRLEMEIARANRFRNPISLLMLDVDHFKKLNDAVGHRAGDDVLRKMASVFQSSLRRVDTLARYGGEEFVVVLPHVTKAEALEVAEKLRAMVEATNFTPDLPPSGNKVTVSVGVANLPVDASVQDKLLDYADAALYASKREGRNRVTAYAPGMEVHPGRERGPFAPTGQAAAAALRGLPVLTPNPAPVADSVRSA